MTATDIDVLRYTTEDGRDTVTITVGDRWVEFPSELVHVLALELALNGPF